MTATTDLGSFPAGETPPDVVVTFESAPGVPIPLTGFDVTATLEGPTAATGLPTGSAAVTDEEAGQVTYTFAEGDTPVPGNYRLTVWAENDPIRHASPLVTYRVYDGPGDTPAFP